MSDNDASPGKSLQRPALLEPEPTGPSASLIAVVLLSLGIIVLLMYRHSSKGEAPRVASLVHGPARGELRAQKDQVVVYVVGAVQNPGVYTLAAGTRAFDAVKAAGGFTAKANHAGVNLAVKLHDEQELQVPAVGEKFPEPVADRDSVAPGASESDDELTPAAPVTPADSKSSPEEDGPGASPGFGRQPGSGSTPAPPPSFQISLNRGTIGEFESIPGLTHDVAAAIVAHRMGPPPRAFTSLDDLATIPGIKKSKLRKIIPYLKL